MRANEMDYNYSGLKKGMRLQAESDGRYWAAKARGLKAKERWRARGSGGLIAQGRARAGGRSVFVLLL